MFNRIFSDKYRLAEFEDAAKSSDVCIKSEQVRSDMNIEFLVLSIDRLDYTKGIPFRIKAFKRLLEVSPELKKELLSCKL